MEVLSAPVILFTLVLAFSLLIERILEVFKTFYILIDSEFDIYRFWTKRAVRLRDKLEKRVRQFDFIHPTYATQFLSYAKDYFVGGRKGIASNVPVISGDLMRGVWIKIICKIAGVTIGIIFAHWQHIDFLQICHSLTDKELFPAAARFSSIGITLSGIIIGLGASPVHKIITYIEHKKNYRTGFKYE
jgi:hypothetical protein